MSPEAQRIAIAEACRWKAIRMSRKWELSDDPHCPQDWCGRHPTADWWSHLPEYTKYLNAMYDAEKVLFGDEVVRKTYRDLIYIQETHNDTAFATAAQRAEAFLRTIGKWEGKG